MSELKKTPIYPEYKAYGGKTIDFGGWDLPVQFSGIKHEHEVTRTKAGLFDVSHMGEIVVKGEKSEAFLQQMTTNDVSKLTPGRAQYTFMCYENGGTVDDFIIYMLEENHYLLVVNAANTDKDFTWLKEHCTFSSQEIELLNVSPEYVQLAIQGPLAEEILQTLTETDLQTITFFRFNADVSFDHVKDKAIVSRTGYTGEDGFEIYINHTSGVSLWNAILNAGEPKGLEPIGLGARDTLRFEAGLPLYTQELSQDISPIEAGLKFAVKVNKDADFIGKMALQKQIENGPERILTGIKMIDKGIPRTGYEVMQDGEKIGVVTSGTQSPTLKQNLGNALIRKSSAVIGDKVEVKVRKRTLQAEIVKTPFYKREK
ncbi:MAG TPA: glycine cleavage system aminomethyltransferase GcvT [Bacillota bacterium]|nr:glycine cleavage system aminomethyltransferase GcvT [Bacillota bacterium]